jgi:hypothetical protein
MVQQKEVWYFSGRWGCSSPSGWFDECTCCASIDNEKALTQHSNNTNPIEHEDKIELRHYYAQCQDEVNVKLRNSVLPTSSEVSQLQVAVNISSGRLAIRLE